MENFKLCYNLLSKGKTKEVFEFLDKESDHFTEEIKISFILQKGGFETLQNEIMNGIVFGNEKRQCEREISLALIKLLLKIEKED